ncbi:MAG: class II aldolase/adducin family protein [Lautropia sp.]
MNDPLVRNHPQRPADIGAAEWRARVDVAAAYRLARLFGWDDLLGTHISLRLPGHEDRFLLNPYGLLFDEITASSLIIVDLDGRKLSESPYPVHRPGFIVHSAVHMGRGDAHCVIHSHADDGVAVSMQQHGLLPASQKALVSWGELRYHDFHGATFDEAERESMLSDLGDGTMMILRNHGTLTVGATVAEAFQRMVRLERACTYQIRALAGGAALNPIAADVIEKTNDQGRRFYAQAGAAGPNELAWAALLRRLDRIDPSYAT